MIMYLLRKIFGSRNERVLNSFSGVVNEINFLEAQFESLRDEELKAKTTEFKERLEHGHTFNDILPEAFAAVREASKRTIGLRHFDAQLLGGIILHEGKIAEMRTGEGKTLVATLPVYLNAISGKGVHLVTVNDYLAKRDSEWMGPIFKFLGLKVGLIQHEMDPTLKKVAYEADVTYITNNELGFDYLRDNMVVNPENRVLRKLNYAIIDEVDSILIDEARTPLIISGAVEESTDKYLEINKIIPMLKGRFVTEAEEVDAKYRNEDLAVGYDFMVDEKNHSVVLTSSGVLKCENILGIENLYNDVESEWVHHITQALKAHNLFKRDVDYVVKNNEVMIVDEFTGRLMPGRRWSDGLHQAVEAKEGLSIANENQTLATITFQNFFRMYNKLSGMTGTALTEADEFYEIYKLDVIEIPTNKPIMRADNADIIYRTQKEKFHAIVNDIMGQRRVGRAVLVGTKTIEMSERLSAFLKKEGVPHNVLNAKYHETEANIIAEAGRKGAVTIATNMAGRGTDIVLGGSNENEEEQAFVKKEGGLHIIGTERHDSRRVDNQLRGRSGRQGDTGSSTFYISLEDDLMRLFGSDRMMGMMTKLGLEDGQDIQHPWISKAIESAQKRVEGMNFDVRKQLINFDDVMNKQREVIYSLRDKLLFSDEIEQNVENVILDHAEERIVEFVPTKGYAEAWKLSELRTWLSDVTAMEVEDLEPCRTYPRASVLDNINTILIDSYHKKVQGYPEEIVRHSQKMIMLQVIDNCWKDHLYNLDQLRSGIGMRAYAQKDPVMEYKQEAYTMFLSMLYRVKEETFEYLFRVNMQVEISARDDDNDGDFDLLHEFDTFSKSLEGKNSVEKKSSSKVGRNDACPCGSGKKYKKCCGK
ncbi:MAG: preprotein translocase subunit SecA [bacterium]|nr:preprotein translocase subunit SecA [bacterium]